MTGREAPDSRGLQRVAGGAAPLVGRLARFGFGAKGLVTILVGALAFRFALGRGGLVTGMQGAIQSLLDEPFGQAFLIVLAAGLAGHALWMFLAALADADRKGRGWQGIVERIAFFVTGIGYALLAYGTLELLSGQGGGGQDIDAIAARVLTPHLGRGLVGLAGAIVMVAGVLQLRLAIRAGFRDSFRRGLTALERRILVVSGRAGYASLGVLSLMVGYSLLRVAIDYDPSEARGWDEALRLLSRLGEGGWPLVVVAVGLILYGFFFVLLARYRAL